MLLEMRIWSHSREPRMGGAEEGGLEVVVVLLAGATQSRESMP